MEDNRTTTTKSATGKSASGQGPKDMEASGSGQADRDKGGKDGGQRSRITVVCKECKRLKLKCDRKTPCGSCVKRGTIPNCEYSQQATEKVDLQSLNNRITALELAYMRKEHGLPTNYLPSYPPVMEKAMEEGIWPGNIAMDPSSSSSTGDMIDVSLPAPNSSSSIPPLRGHGHHHHLAAPYTSDTRTGQDSANDAFRELQGLRPSVSGSASRVDGGEQVVSLMKQEQDHAASDDIVMTSVTSSRLPRQDASARGSSSAPRRKTKKGAVVKASVIPDRAAERRRQQQQQAQLSLPSRRVFYPVDAQEESPATLTTPPSAARKGLPSTRPALTEELRNALPDRTTCRELVAEAWETFARRTVELGLPSVPQGKSERDAFIARCKRLYPYRLTSASGSGRSKEKEKASKSRMSVESPVMGLRRESFGDRSSRRSPSPSKVQRQESLPFFALMCAVMAVGASRRSMGKDAQVLTNPEERASSPAFLVGLSQLALDVWLENDQQDLGSSPELDNQIREERAEYIRACLVQVHCLLGSEAVPLSALSSSIGCHSEKDSILRIIGKMVTALQTWGHISGLFGDSDEETHVDTIVAEVEEARRRTWWDVLFYDSLISEALGKPCLAPGVFYNVQLPALQPEEVRRGNGPGDGSGGTSRLRSERQFLAVRSRLIQLVHAVNQRLSSPGCCCGYTLDQAVSLWTEVQQWMKTIPTEFADAFELTSSSGLVGLGKHLEGHTSLSPSSPGVDEREGALEDRRWQQSRGCELALVAHSLILKTFAPFVPLVLRQSSNTSIKDFRLPMREYLSACQAIIRISKVFWKLLDSNLSRSSLLPITLDIYALDKVVLDATIACSVILTPLAQKLGHSDRNDQGTIELMHSVKLGLDLLGEPHGTGLLNPVGSDMDDLSQLQDQWDSHYGELQAASSKLKRKHSTLTDEVRERRPSPGPSNSDCARHSDDDDDDKMDEGGPDKGDEGSRGRQADSFSGSYSYGDFTNPTEPDSRGWGTMSMSSKPATERTEDSPSTEKANLPSIVHSRGPRKPQVPKRMGIRIRLGPDGKPLNVGLSKEAQSKAAKTKPSESRIVPQQLSLHPSSTDSTSGSLAPSSEQSPISALSHEHENSLLSLASRRLTNNVVIEAPSHPIQAKAFYDYSLPNQPTESQAARDQAYATPVDSYDYGNNYGYAPPSGLVRRPTSDPSSGHGHHSAIQSHNHSPVYTPNISAPSGEYFIPPGNGPFYDNAGAFNQAIPLHDSGLHQSTSAPLYQGYYPEAMPPVQPTATNWELGGHAEGTSRQQWNPGTQPGWQQS